MVMLGETVDTGAPLPYEGAQPEVLSSGGGRIYIGYLDEDGLPYTRELSTTDLRGGRATGSRHPQPGPCAPAVAAAWRPATKGRDRRDGPTPARREP